MENRSSDKRSKISLDRVLREVAELENSRGEPDRIWSLSDIDDLLASTDTDSTAPADEDDTELLTSIQYYEGRYSDDDTPSESEPVYNQQGTEEPKDQADSDPEIAAEPDAEVLSVEAEAAAEPEVEKSVESNEAEQTDKESDKIEESEASAGEISSSELNTSEEPVDETSSEEPANEETAEAPAEPEKAEAAQESADEAEPEVGEAPVEEAAADESEDIYFDSKLELSVVKADGEDDDIQESEPKDEVDTDESNKTDESDNSDNILTLHGEEEESEDEDEAEKKPTVEELFGAPASRYFGEPTEEPEEDPERESRAIPGLFGDTVVFGPMKSLSEPTQSKPDDKYKTKLMAAIGSAKEPQSAETIEKPGVILKRGPLSETSGLEPCRRSFPPKNLSVQGTISPRR